MNYYHLFFKCIFSVLMLFSLAFSQDTTIAVTSDGNVGIGITNPTQKLVIDGYTRIVESNRLMFGGPFSAEYIYNPTGNTMRFHVGSGDRLTIAHNGDLGIGLTNPAARLHVLSDGGFANPQAWLKQSGGDGFVRMRFSNESDQYWDIAGSPNNQLRLYSGTGGSDVMTLTADGKVGINTIDPQARLHVVGGLHLEKLGGQLDRLILKTASQNDPGRYGILFSNNLLAPFLGDDIGDQHFDFFSTWGNQRTYDAVLSIHGKANGQWGNVLRLTHDGTDGYISTDTGNMILNPADGSANVGIGTNVPAGKLDVNGTIYQRGGQIHADYVFGDDYRLESIEEHTDYMWQNKHLKAIPKAMVDKNGLEYVEVGAHRKGIVEELEKAHIYIDQLNTKIKALEERLEKVLAASNNKD